MGRSAISHLPTSTRCTCVVRTILAGHMAGVSPPIHGREVGATVLVSCSL